MATCQVTERGTLIWFNEFGQIHRDNDLPAIIESDGTQHWYKNGQTHRENDLPAIMWFDGRNFWYKDDEEYSPQDLK